MLGVVGISVLEQADMLVREGVGEHVRGRDESCWSRGRGELLDAKDVSLTGEAGSDVETSTIISNALRRTDRRIGFTDDDGARGRVRGAALGLSSVVADAPRNANSSLP